MKFPRHIAYKIVQKGYAISVVPTTLGSYLPIHPYSIFHFSGKDLYIYCHLVSVFHRIKPGVFSEFVVGFLRKNGNVESFIKEHYPELWNDKAGRLRIKLLGG